MVEEIRDLIDKINQEGIQAAEQKAKHIEEEARQRVAEILQKAKAEAEKLIEDAKKEISGYQESARASLKQAGRDLLLDLKKELNEILGRLVTFQIKEALKPQEMAQIIYSLIKEYKGKEKGDIVVSLNKADLEKLEKAMFSALQGEIKSKIVLKPSEEISAGFLISYDSGKSYFDFTDTALVEYISMYLKPKLTEILQDPSAK